MSNATSDHIALTAVVSTLSSTKLLFARRRAPTCDRKAVRAACEAVDDGNDLRRQADILRKYVEDMPAIPFCFDPCSHASLLDTYLLYGLQYFFPIPQRVVRQPYLPLETFTMLCLGLCGITQAGVRVVHSEVLVFHRKGHSEAMVVQS